MPKVSTIDSRKYLKCSNLIDRSLIKMHWAYIGPNFERNALGLRKTMYMWCVLHLIWEAALFFSGAMSHISPWDKRPMGLASYTLQCLWKAFCRKNVQWCLLRGTVTRFSHNKRGKLPNMLFDPSILGENGSAELPFSLFLLKYFK